MCLSHSLETFAWGPILRFHLFSNEDGTQDLTNARPVSALPLSYTHSSHVEGFGVFFRCRFWFCDAGDGTQGSCSELHPHVFFVLGQGLAKLLNWSWEWWHTPVGG